MVYAGGIKMKKSTAKQHIQTDTTLTMPCPRCNKRVFDASAMPTEPLAIQLKCPHCSNIVTVTLPTKKSDTV